MPSERARQRSGSISHEFLTSRNILVRPLDAYGLDNYLRITVGLDRENEKLIDGFSAFVGRLS